MARDADHPLAAPLLATSPSAATAAACLFGQFVGSWDLQVAWFKNGNLIREERGEWHFGWILGGRAIQDVWIVPPRAEQERGSDPYEYGTSIRFYDASLYAWRSTWHGPVQGSVRSFHARARRGHIVLEGQQLDGREIRWVFSKIRRESFSWKFEQRSADGDRWDVLQAFECTRRS